MSAPGVVLVRDRLQLRVDGTRRIPAAARSAIDAADALVEQTNVLWRNAQLEAANLREEARRAGYEQGRGEAVAALAAELATAVGAIREELRASERRVLAVAVGLVRRIAPSLDADALVTELAGSALAALDAERYVRVRVHPRLRDAVAGQLPRWQAERPQLGSLCVQADASLAMLDCVVESELGRVQAGLGQQLNLLRDSLEATIAGGRTHGEHG